MIRNVFYESSLNSFLAPQLHYSFTRTRTQAPSTKLIHGKQNASIIIQPHSCIMSLFVDNHRHFRAKGLRSDHAFWQSLSSSGELSCDPLSDPIPDYWSPAAGAAEWLHYVSEGPDEGGDEESGLLFNGDFSVSAHRPVSEHASFQWTATERQTQTGDSSHVRWQSPGEGGRLYIYLWHSLFKLLWSSG